MPDEGGLQVFWQSASMLHDPMQPAPPLVVELPLDEEVAPLVLVELLLLDEVLPDELPEVFPELPVPPPAPVCVVVEAPNPPTVCSLLPEAQATNRAELVEKRATKVSLAYFTVVQTTLIPFVHTTSSCVREAITCLALAALVPRSSARRTVSIRIASGDMELVR
jgi:hypothetical protein